MPQSPINTLFTILPPSDVQTVADSLYRDESPPIVLMGHRYIHIYVGRLYNTPIKKWHSIHSVSMGGAIAVHVAAKLTIPSLIGLAVIDVVEGKVSL